MLRLLIFILIIFSLNAEKVINTIEIRGPIFIGVANYVERALAQANQQYASAVVIYIDTPGGDLMSTQKIIQAILSSQVPVLCFVSPSGSMAASAGLLILISCDIAAVTPGSTLGAATPVMATGEKISEDMRKKAIEIVASLAKSISEEKNRNIEWVKKAVTEAIAASAQEALSERVIDLVAKSEEDLFSQLKTRTIKSKDREHQLGDFAEYKKIPIEQNLKEHILQILGSPEIAGLLLSLGLIGIALEFYNPGLIFPGALGLVFLISGLILLRYVPITIGAGVLIFVGLIMIIADFFAGTIILGVIGAVALLAGLFYYFDPSAPPLEITLSGESFLPLAAGLAVLLLWLILEVRKAFFIQHPSGINMFKGQSGIALGDFTTEGSVFFQGTIWKARNISKKPVQRNQKVKVVDFDGLVAKIEPEEN